MDRHAAAPDDDMICMALVQAFEFTYELAWKTMKDYLESEGFDEPSGSKQTIRTAFQAKLIADADAWMSAVERRNIVSHDYNQVLLHESIAYITGSFFPLMRALYAELSARLSGGMP
jgi:nucleotidyltransferase substrate binding protein (TIGR01987 family)